MKEKRAQCVIFMINTYQKKHLLNQKQEKYLYQKIKINWKIISKFNYIWVFLGQELGSEIGSGLGSFVGNRFKHIKEGERIGRVVDKITGSYLPFHNGGIVKPDKGKTTQIIVAQKVELIIPKNMENMLVNLQKIKLKEKVVVICSN